jgi:hypothetical protein
MANLDESFRLSSKRSPFLPGVFTSSFARNAGHYRTRAYPGSDENGLHLTPNVSNLDSYNFHTKRLVASTAYRRATGPENAIAAPWTRPHRLPFNAMLVVTEERGIL